MYKRQAYTIGTGGSSVVALIVDHLAPRLVGRDPDCIEAIFRDLFFATHATAVGAITSLALAAIDTALWDWRCRRAGLPLWKAAGGAQPKVPVYSTEGGWLHLEADALVRESLQAKADGFKGVKIKVGRPTIAEDIARLIGHGALVVPSFTVDTERSLDDWKEWADRFNAAGEVARRAGIWLMMHNEPGHQRPLAGRVPFEVFAERIDPRYVRLQLDVGNMTMGGGDPMAFLAKYGDRCWSFHLKDVVPDRSGDTELGKGTVDLHQLLAAVTDIERKTFFVEQEGAKDSMASARRDFEYLASLEF